MFDYDLVHYSNVVLLRLPKTPDNLVGEGMVFTAKNGCTIHRASYAELCKRGIFLRGEYDNDRDDNYVTYACTDNEDAKKMVIEIKEALEEFIEKVIDKKKTRLEVFKELFPEAQRGDDGYPVICTDIVRKPHTCELGECDQCKKDFWDVPAPESFQEGDK